MGFGKAQKQRRNLERKMMFKEILALTRTTVQGLEDSKTYDYFGELKTGKEIKALMNE